MFKKIKELLTKNKSTKQTIVKNVFWISFGNIVGRVIRGVFVIYAARILGAADYGVFSYALGLAAFFTIFGDLGVSGVFTREASKKPEYTNEYFATTLIIKIILSIFAALILVFLTPFISRVEEVRVLLPIIAFLVIGDNLQGFFVAFFRTKERMELEAFVILVTNIAITVAGMLTLYFHPTTRALTFAYVGAAFVSIIPTLYIARKELSQIFIRFQKNLVGPFLAIGIPFALQGIFGGFMLNTDMIILGWMRSTQEIGIYSAGQKIVYILYLLPTILAGSIFPVQSRLIEKQETEKIRILIEKGISVMYCIALPLTLGGIILGKSILGFLFGAEFISGTLSFQFLIATIIFVFPMSIISNTIFVNNKQKSFLLFTIIAAITNLILDVIFIRLWGIAGCALATLFVQAIYITLSWRFMKRLHHFSIMKHLKKIILASIVMGIFTFILDYFFHINVIINIVLAIIFYFSLLYLLKERIFQEVLEIFKFVRVKNNV